MRGMVGREVAAETGAGVARRVGAWVGGPGVGRMEGRVVGARVGRVVGGEEGRRVLGAWEGTRVGAVVGRLVKRACAAAHATEVGAAVGERVVGPGVGRSEGGGLPVGAGVVVLSAVATRPAKASLFPLPGVASWVLAKVKAPPE